MAEYQITQKQREIKPCGAVSYAADSSHIARGFLALNGARIAGLVYRSESVHQTPATHGAARVRVRVRYISMVLRIRPTARPSISKGSSGCTTITG